MFSWFRLWLISTACRRGGIGLSVVLHQSHQCLQCLLSALTTMQVAVLQQCQSPIQILHFGLVRRAPPHEVCMCLCHHTAPRMHSRNEISSNELVPNLSSSHATTRRTLRGAPGRLSSTRPRVQANVARAMLRHCGDKLSTLEFRCGFDGK